jgi:hypothetical protein
MFEVDKFYTHPGMYDCVLKIRNVNKDKDDNYSLGISPFMKNGVCLEINEYVTVKKEDAYKWKEYKFK